MAGQVFCNGCLHAPGRYPRDAQACAVCCAWIEAHEGRARTRTMGREIRRRRRDILINALLATTAVALACIPSTIPY